MCAANSSQSLCGSVVFFKDKWHLLNICDEARSFSVHILIRVDCLIIYGDQGIS